MQIINEILTFLIVVDSWTLQLKVAFLEIPSSDERSFNGHSFASEIFICYS